MPIELLLPPNTLQFALWPTIESCTLFWLRKQTVLGEIIENMRNVMS